MKNAPVIIDSKGERPRHNYLILAIFVIGLLIVNALVSYTITRMTPPRVVAFDMKQTVDAFFDRASQKKLSEEQTKTLSSRFTAALESSLQAYQQKNHVLILVSPAVVQGAPDITRDIQRDIARRMRGE